MAFPDLLTTPEPRQLPPFGAPRTLRGRKGCSLETGGPKQSGLRAQRGAAARPRALTIVLVAVPPPRHAACYCAAELSCESPATPEPSGCRPAGARSAARRADWPARRRTRSPRLPEARERRDTGRVPPWKAGACSSTRGRLLPPSTLGLSRRRAKLLRPQRSRLSFAPARPCFPGGPCADAFGDFRSEVTSQGLCAHARGGGGRGLEGVEKRQVGEGRPWKGLRSAGTCPHPRRPAVAASGGLGGKGGQAIAQR